MNQIIPVERIENRIYLIRGQKVMLDSDLAELYGVQTKILNKAVKRNCERFPMDFMFQLTAKETELIRLHLGHSKLAGRTSNLRFQNGTSSSSRQGETPVAPEGPRHGGRRYLPYAFTEQGVAMLSGVLQSPRAVQVNIAIMRAFVKLRGFLASHADLARKLEVMEGKYDAQFRLVFDAIRALRAPLHRLSGRIGFRRGNPRKDVRKPNGAAPQSTH